MEAFYLKIWLEDELSFWESVLQEDVDYLERFASTWMFLYVVLAKEYFERLLDIQLIRSKGLTPNPMMCNNHIKFGFFWRHLKGLILYLRSLCPTDEIKGVRCLKQAVDPIKDQIYFLSQVPLIYCQRFCFRLGT